MATAALKVSGLRRALRVEGNGNGWGSGAVVRYRLGKSPVHAAPVPGPRGCCWFQQ